MAVKPSDLAKKAAVKMKVGDIDVEGNTIIAEGIITDNGELIVTDELAEDMNPDVEMAVDIPDNLYRTFTDQAFAPIGTPTDDMRILASNIDLSFRSFPLPLMWCKQSTGGHDQSYTVGVIEDARVEGDRVMASGYMLNSPEADEAAYQNAHGVSNPSVDLVGADYSYTDENGNALDSLDMQDLVDSDVRIYKTFTKAKMIGTTLVATPAFDTRIALDSERSSREVALVASAATHFQPTVYRSALFGDPNLSGPTLPTMGDDGRIYGHLAVFNQCHRSIQDACVMVPRSPTQYSHFHTSPAVRLDDGTRLPVGRLTTGTGHADPYLGGAPATAHYDNTGSCFAFVRVGEDRHGIWFSGIPAPGASAGILEQGLAAPLSGDWRDFGQGLELVAALAVNTPGFSARGITDDQDRPIALVASGRLSPRTRRSEMTMARNELKDVIKEAIVEQTMANEMTIKRDAALARAREAAEKFRPQSPRDRIGELLAARY